MALDVADRAGLHVMCHIDEPPPTYEAVVERLRPGDVLTHCFRPFPNAPVHGDGRIKEAVIAARERGVLFDVGHGMGSFSWDTARKMMAAGFRPDTISSDVHALCIEGPAWDLLRTMTKFLALGMTLPEVIQRATVAPADAIRRPDLGRLAPGAAGDASVIRLAEIPTELEDVQGNLVHSDTRLVPEGMVIGGQVGGDRMTREVSVWSYPWDLHDLGLDAALGRLAAQGVNTVSLATSYHAGRFLQPGNPRRRVWFPQDGTVYYTVDPARWAGRGDRAPAG